MNPFLSHLPLNCVQVFISVDELDLAERGLKAQDDPALTEVTGDATTVVAAVEQQQQQSVEFDSPDSGLPSSRNYSVTSGILSSIEDGQSICFEDGVEEESSVDSQRADPDPPHKMKDLESQGSGTEERLGSQMDCKASGEESISVCCASYTVSAPQEGSGLGGHARIELCAVILECVFLSDHGLGPLLPQSSSSSNLQAHPDRAGETCALPRQHM